MARIVMKFGGTSMAGMERIRNVALRVKHEVGLGNEVAVIVSAFDKDTTTAKPTTKATTTKATAEVCTTTNPAKANPKTAPVPGTSKSAATTTTATSAEVA